MFSQKPCYFSQLSRTYPILRPVDVCDRQSFIRAYVLDNIYICILMYILFYAALCYAANKLDRLILLRSKKSQFEEVIVKTTDAQKVTAKHLENEMYRLGAELITTSGKIAQLEKIVEKYKHSDKSHVCPASAIAARDGEFSEGGSEDVASSLENVKILEPSFPPSVPPEPPPRKYGIFVSRPPGQRRASPTAAPTTPPPKIGFK